LQCRAIIPLSLLTINRSRPCRLWLIPPLNRLNHRIPTRRRFVPVNRCRSDKQVVSRILLPCDFTICIPTETGWSSWISYQNSGNGRWSIFSLYWYPNFTHKACKRCFWKTRLKNHFRDAGEATVDSRNFEVMNWERRSGLRAPCLSNPKAWFKVSEVHDLGIGRSAKELVRKSRPLSDVASHDGEVCPASCAAQVKILVTISGLVLGKILKKSN